jgi:hypothetical protein
MYFLVLFLFLLFFFVTDIFIINNVVYENKGGML